jgi:hypothetical protein
VLCSPHRQLTTVKSDETEFFNRVATCPPHLRSKLLSYALRDHYSYLLSAIPKHVVWRDALRACLLKGESPQKVMASADSDISDAPTRG